MEEKAVKYYREGYNCSSCILKAAESTYKIPINKQCISMCQGINNGFGIGNFCSVLIASIMVFGLLFDKETTKRLRMSLINEFSEKRKNMDCYTLKKDRGAYSDCSEIVREIASITEKLIDREGR